MPGIKEFGKKDEPYGRETLFRELGYYILRLEYYEKSLRAFNEAIKYTPDNIRALIGRSRSRARAGQYKGALEDVNNALKLDPDNLVILAEKALDTYLFCDLEDGLVQNSRFLTRRKQPNNFALGVMHCSNAIETAIGAYAGRPLRDHFKIVRKLAWKKNRESLEGYAEKKERKKASRFYVCDTPEEFQIPSMNCMKKKKIGTDKKGLGDCKLKINTSLHSHKSEESFIPPFSQEFPFHPLQNYTSNIDNFIAEKYLESMYLDKNFLKKVANEPGSSCPNKKGSDKIKYLAKRGYKMVSYKQELLRTRRPFYHIKYKEGTSTATLKVRQAEALYMQQQTTKKEVNYLLNKFNELFRQKKFKAMFQFGEKLRNYCDSMSKRVLPDKDKYLEEVFQTTRQAYYQLHRINLDQYPWDQVKRIYLAFGLPISRVPSTDSVIDDIKPVYTDNKKEMQRLEKRLTEDARSVDEICWCYYEMCKNSIEMKQYEMAKIYAKQCIHLAKEISNLEWHFITTMLLVRIHIDQRNKIDAANELCNAKQLADKLSNENLVLYVGKCFNVIDQIVFDDTQSPQILVKREKLILGLLNDERLKDEFSHLFRVMNAIPAQRRMSVMPGIKATETKLTKCSTMKSIQPASYNISTSVGETYLDDNSLKGARVIRFHLDNKKSK